MSVSLNYKVGLPSLNLLLQFSPLCHMNKTGQLSALDEYVFLNIQGI